MAPDVTIFAAKYLVFIDLAIAIAVLAVALWNRPRNDVLKWCAGTVILLGLSYLFAHIAGSVYSDPRPFTQDHVKPLISHAADNGFPSDHALLAAGIVAVVGLVDIRLTPFFVVLMVFVDWARVGSGVHHPVDVIASAVLVAIATVIALPVSAYVIEVWDRYRLRTTRAGTSGGG